MPLTTTADWPTLTDGKKAKASEVETKFDWLEGSILPMVGGEFTTNTYDIGNTTHNWKTGHFTNLIIGGFTMTAEDVGAAIDAFAQIESAGSITATNPFNVASVVRDTTGTFTITFTTPFANATYAVVANPVVTNGVIATTNNYSTASVQVILRDTAGALQNVRFNIIAVGS